MLRPFKALVSSEDGSTVLTSFQNLFSTSKFVNHIAQLAKRLQAALIVCPDSSVPKRADGEQDAKTDSGMWVSCHVGSAGLPMEHPYREPEIYVRPCYPYFYDLIKGSLYEDDEQGVTVSGTPGIGKSVFFAYFLVRYSEMNPGTTVITIPSGREGKHSVMEKLVVWRGGKIVAEKRNEQVIQLYDGAPKVSPKEAKFVCFTSPCEPWFDHIRKFSYYSTFYMPLWALDELQTAARALNLPIRAPIHGTGTVLKDVERRFNIFGGTARECLSTSAKFVTRRKLEIEAMIDKFDSLKPSVIGHYAPIHNDPTRYEIVASSKYIQRLLIESLTPLRIEQREEVISSLEIRSSAAVYRGALFEMAMHDQLSAGCTFAARRLGGDTIETFACERSGPTHSCYFDSDFSSSLLSTGPYRIPRARNFAAIDSFYYSTAHSAKPKLWLFQSTVAPSHPVSGEGVLELLEGLSLLEMVTAEPDQVALIFVVPEKNAPEFGPPKIDLKENDKLHFCHLGGRRYCLDEAEPWTNR